MSTSRSFRFRFDSSPLSCSDVRTTDLQRIIADTDITSLQGYVRQTTFSPVESADLRKLSPQQVADLFTLQQLITQYLLHCQETLVELCETRARETKDALSAKAKVEKSLAKRLKEIRRLEMENEELVRQIDHIETAKDRVNARRQRSSSGKRTAPVRTCRACGRGRSVSPPPYYDEYRHHPTSRGFGHGDCPDCAARHLHQLTSQLMQAQKPPYYPYAAWDGHHHPPPMAPIAGHHHMYPPEYPPYPYAYHQPPPPSHHHHYPPPPPTSAHGQQPSTRTGSSPSLPDTPAPTSLPSRHHVDITLASPSAKSVLSRSVELLQLGPATARRSSAFLEQQAPSTAGLDGSMNNLVSPAKVPLLVPALSPLGCSSSSSSATTRPTVTVSSMSASSLPGTGSAAERLQVSAVEPVDASASLEAVVVPAPTGPVGHPVLRPPAVIQISVPTDTACSYAKNFVSQKTLLHPPSVSPTSMDADGQPTRADAFMAGESFQSVGTLDQDDLNANASTALPSPSPDTMDTLADAAVEAMTEFNDNSWESLLADQQRHLQSYRSEMLSMHVSRLSSSPRHQQQQSHDETQQDQSHHEQQQQERSGTTQSPISERHDVSPPIVPAPTPAPVLVVVPSSLNVGHGGSLPTDIPYGPHISPRSSEGDYPVAVDLPPDTPTDTQPESEGEPEQDYLTMRKSPTIQLLSQGIQHGGRSTPTGLPPQVPRKKSTPTTATAVASGSGVLPVRTAEQKSSASPVGRGQSSNCLLRSRSPTPRGASPQTKPPLVTDTDDACGEMSNDDIVSHNISEAVADREFPSVPLKLDETQLDETQDDDQDQLSDRVSLDPDQFPPPSSPPADMDLTVSREDTVVRAPLDDMGDSQLVHSGLVDSYNSGSDKDEAEEEAEDDCNRCQFCDHPCGFDKLIHENACALRTARCRFCNTEILETQLTWHQEDECELRPLKCQHCDEEFLAKDLPGHESACENELQVCDYCGASLGRDSSTIPAHHKVCDYFPVDCTRCGDSISRKNLQDHMNDCDGPGNTTLLANTSSGSGSDDDDNSNEHSHEQSAEAAIKGESTLTRNSDDAEEAHDQVKPLRSPRPSHSKAPTDSDTDDEEALARWESKYQQQQERLLALSMSRHESWRSSDSRTDRI